MEEQLREQVARGVAWSMAEKIGSMLSMTAVRLVILNLLEPRIFGCFAIPSAVAAVAMVVADSGFSQNLIRRRDPGPRDYKAVFVFNMALSSALYVLLALLAPVAARYYGMPEIARIAPVFLLLLPLSSLCSVQNAIFTALSLHHGFVPATINYQVPDPECDLDVVPNTGRTADIRYALSNSLGFGGHNGSILFKKWEE